jgi:hypothetical protein
MRKSIVKIRIGFIFLGLSMMLIPLFAKTQTAQAPADKPYLVEWVYRVKYGFRDEWWKKFQQYQIATLDKEKALGYISDYTVFGPGLHTSEESRWDFRIVITYKNQGASSHGAEVEKLLFGESPNYKKDENRRWELTSNHWDLPIHTVDPHAVN